MTMFLLIIILLPLFLLGLFWRFRGSLESNYNTRPESERESERWRHCRLRFRSVSTRFFGKSHWLRYGLSNLPGRPAFELSGCSPSSTGLRPACRRFMTVTHFRSGLSFWKGPGSSCGMIE